MSHPVNVAAIHFRMPNENDARTQVLRDLRSDLATLEGSGIDLVVTCEGVESRGQSLAQAESVDSPGEILSIYRDFARANGAVVAGSIKLAEDGLVYNAVVLALPSGELRPLYRKRFLTPTEVERGLSPGRTLEALEAGGMRLAAAICFDLNFIDTVPDYRALAPDFLLFASMFEGGFLQQYWAYTARCFFVSACKDYRSRIIDPLGRTLASTIDYTRIVRARVNTDRFVMHLDQNLPKFPDLYRQYRDAIDIDISAELGTAVLYSRTEEISAPEIAAAAGLTGIDEYLTGCAQLSDGASVQDPAHKDQA